MGANLAGNPQQANEDQIGLNEHYNRIALLASSLKRDELLTLDIQSILHRLFWEEQLLQFEPQHGDNGPKFSCSCSRERVSKMIRGLGLEEAQSILQEQGQIEVGCDFCAAQYRFDAVDVTQIFLPPGGVPVGSDKLH